MKSTIACLITAILCAVASCFLLLNTIAVLDSANKQLSALSKISLCVLRTIVNSSDFRAAATAEEEKTAMEHYEGDFNALVAAFREFADVKTLSTGENCLLDDARHTSEKIDRIVHKMREVWTSKEGGPMGIGKYQVMMVGMAKITEHTRAIELKLSSLRSSIESGSNQNKLVLFIAIGSSAASALACISCLITLRGKKLS